MTRIEREARSCGNARLHAAVNITAEPFFRRKGLSVVKRQTKIYRNRAFRKADMEKRLSRAGHTRRRGTMALKRAFPNRRCIGDEVMSVRIGVWRMA